MLSASSFGAESSRFGGVGGGVGEDCKGKVAVFDENVPQTLKSFVDEADQPLTLGILLDTSVSQIPGLPVEQVAAGKFVHTFCSRLEMAGATTIEIKQAARHKTMSQAAWYAHLSPKHKQSVVDRIAVTIAESEDRRMSQE